MRRGERFISSLSLEQHPELRRQHFPEDIWPVGLGDKKEDEECWTFLWFARAAGLSLSSRPHKRQPPFPDLECVVGGAPTRFELSEILETALAEGFAYSEEQATVKSEALARGDTELAASIQTWGTRSFPGNASLERVLRRKLMKPYETGRLATELLLYYDQQVPLGPFNYLCQWQDELAQLMRRSVFRKVWIFCLQPSTVIGYIDLMSDDTVRFAFDQRFDLDFRGQFQALDAGTDETKAFAPALVTRQHS